MSDPMRIPGPVLGPALPDGGADALADMKKWNASQDVVRTAQDFESLLLGEVFSSMRKTVSWSDEPSFATSTFDAMFDEEIAKAMALSGGMGLAESVAKELQGQENGPKVAPKIVDK